MHSKWLKPPKCVIFNQHALVPQKSKISSSYFCLLKDFISFSRNVSANAHRPSAWTFIALDDGWAASPAALCCLSSAALVCESLVKLSWSVSLSETFCSLLSAGLELFLLNVLTWSQRSLLQQRFLFATCISLETQFLKVFGAHLGPTPASMWLIAHQN